MENFAGLESTFNKGFGIPFEKSETDPSLAKKETLGLINWTAWAT